MATLADTQGRSITYLRISVTDRCNLRCRYCMPAEGILLQEHSQILSFEEITQIVREAAALGIREVRLTGGEPLVRRDLPRLVAMLTAIPGIEEVTLTTNGTLLARHAHELRQAGLSRVNISLDTLDPARFAEITRGGRLEDVWEGIAAAEAAGLTPIKLNCVVVRGFNDGELPVLAALTLNHPWQVRFIEYMPVSNLEDSAWQSLLPQPEKAYLSASEMREILAPLQLEAVEGAHQASGRGPARLWRARGGQGLIGFISPLSDHFCAACNRLRLTADGYLRPCLLSDDEIPVLQALRQGEELRPLLQEAVRAKPANHGLAVGQRPQGRCMAQIGG